MKLEPETKKAEDASSSFYSPVQLFEIFLHRDEYFPGEIVTGKVLIVASKSFQVDNKDIQVYIKFAGRAVAKWRKRSSLLCGLKDAEHVKGKKTYFSNTYRYDIPKIAEGNKALPFQFELPSEIPPSTFSEDRNKRNVKIVYTVEALMKIGNQTQSSDQTIFIVKGLLNLTAFTELSFPVTKTAQEFMFKMQASLKKQGFVPGEQARIKLSVKCSSLKTLTRVSSSIRAELIQEIELSLHHNSHFKRRNIASEHVIHVVTSGKNAEKSKNLHLPRCHHHEKQMILTLKIPEDCLVSFQDKLHNFFHVRYFIRVTVSHTPFPYKPVYIKLPIKVGTVWIKEHKTQEPPILLLTTIPAPTIPELQVDETLETEPRLSSSLPNPLLLPPPSTSGLNTPPDNSKTSTSALCVSTACLLGGGLVDTLKKEIGGARGANSVRDSSAFLAKPQQSFSTESPDCSIHIAEF